MARTRDRAELVSSDTGLAAAIAVETHGELGEVEPVEARSYWSQVWRRFRRDKIAIGSAVFILFLVAVAIVGGPIAARLLGQGPNDIFFDGVDENLLPVGPLTWVQDPLRPGEQTLFVLGADSTLGRDDGPQTSPGRPRSWRTLAGELGSRIVVKRCLRGSKRTTAFAPKSVSHTICARRASRCP